MVLVSVHPRLRRKSSPFLSGWTRRSNRWQKRVLQLVIGSIFVVLWGLWLRLNQAVLLNPTNRQESTRLRTFPDKVLQKTRDVSSSLASPAKASRPETKTKHQPIEQQSAGAAGRQGVEHRGSESSQGVEQASDHILTYYLESPTTIDSDTKPLPRRRTSRAQLKKISFPKASCSSFSLENFPIDDFPHEDPFLPFIHDYFIRHDETPVVQFVAQNRRRCETNNPIAMKYWEPQMALFQPVPVLVQQINNSHHNNKTLPQYRLSSPDDATAPETRFLCHFHAKDGSSETTFSLHSIPYEYVNWRKHKGEPMFALKGPDVHKFEFSQLLFSCPIPERFRGALTVQSSHYNRNSVWLDLVPIRTPARRGKWLLTPQHIGPTYWAELSYFNTTVEYGTDHILPALQDSGRISNLALCPTTTREFSNKTKKHRLVVCTWTASSYNRRGDQTRVQDSALRLQEWLVFHRLAGVDHIYVYDNTQESPSPLQKICARFSDWVTYIPWPATVCNNNRPNHKNPGERSSQYAAEASCRERFGSTTEWMSFIDTDEYLVPMRWNTTWTDILEDVSRDSPHVQVLKFRSSRGRPRLDLMQLLPNQTECKPQTRRKPRGPLDPCLTHRPNETFLRTYNCEYIRPPRPDRFARAMKQIYRPSFVLSHFVHYSTVTADIARSYRDSQNYSRKVRDREWGDAFVDELTQGTLVHTKSVLPHETMQRTTHCQTGSKASCPVGLACPESTAFNDSIHTLNLFVDENGQFCNCWLNTHVEYYWVPRLERALQELGDL